MTTIAASEVPVAVRSSSPSQRTSSGTMTTPPPTPKRPLKTPAAVPMTASVRVRPRGMAGILGTCRTRSTLADALAPLRADPARAAVLLDVDGTLAPIVRHAEDAHVPEPTRTLLIAIAKRYGLVACVSGPPARRSRGGSSRSARSPTSATTAAEILRGGATEPEVDPEVAAWAQRVQEFAARALEDAALRRLRVRGEDKEVIAAFHWRGAPDEEAAERAVRAVAEQAEAAGLVTHWGRKVLEVRPPVRLDKGARRRAPARRRRARRGRLRRRRPHRPRRLRGAAPPRGGGAPGTALCVGVRSDETPPSSRPRPTCWSTAARRAPAARGAARPEQRALRRLPQDGRAAQRGRGDAARRHRASPARRPTTTRRSSSSRRRWWVIAAAIGALARPPRAGHAADRPGARRTRKSTTSLPELRPGVVLVNRLWPLLLSTAGRGRARRRGSRRSRRSRPASRSSGRWPGATRTRRWRRSRTATA